MDAYRDLGDRHHYYRDLFIINIDYITKVCLNIILALADRGFDLVSDT